MRKNILLSVLLVTALSLSACIGSGSVSEIKTPEKKNQFPQLRGIDLTGTEYTIPSALDGQKKLLLIAFKREQQEQVDTWLNVAKEIEAQHEGFRYYELPVIYEGSAPFRFWVNNGMRSGIPDQTARERTITVYTDRDKFWNITNTNENNIYALLVNEVGEIIWRKEGVATEAYIASLKSELQKQ